MLVLFGILGIAWAFNPFLPKTESTIRTNEFHAPKLADPQINLITPANTTYLEPMEGYYPGTYGFDSETPGNLPKNWTAGAGTGCTVNVTAEHDGHKGVVCLFDDGTSDSQIATIQQNVAATSGTIEFWIHTDYSGANGEFRLILQEGGNFFYNMWITSDRVYYPDGVAWLEYGFVTPSHGWHRLQLAFNCDTDKANLTVDGVKLAETNAALATTGIQFVRLWTGFTGTQPAHKVFLDAISYSWDPSYTLGDNKREGMFLEYTNSTVLDWASYSLDGQTNVTLDGNTTLKFPVNDGSHSLVVYGSESGTIYDSGTRYFSSKMMILNSPANTTYTAPSFGRYPGTYTFDECDIGPLNSLEGWTVGAGPGCTINVTAEHDGHKGVVCGYDDGTIDLQMATIMQTGLALTSGTIELWIHPDFSGANGQVMLILQQGGLFFYNLRITNDRVYYPDGGTELEYLFVTPSHGWHRFEIAFDTDTDKANLTVDGVKLTETDAANPTPPIQVIKIWTNYSGTGPAHAVYYDAISFSWDEEYTVGDNAYEGLGLDFYGNTEFSGINYSLDGQQNVTIIGNTTIRAPSNGPHAIQLYGNTSAGNQYITNVSYFTMNTPIPTLLAGNFTNNTNVLGADLLQFQVSDADRNLINESVTYSLNSGITNVTNWTQPCLLNVTSLNEFLTVDVWAQDAYRNSAHEQFRVGTNTAAPTLEFFTTIPDTINTLPINVSFIASDTNLSQVKLSVYDALMNLVNEQTKSIGVSLQNNTAASFLLNDLCEAKNYQIRLTARDVFGVETIIQKTITTSLQKFQFSQGVSTLKWYDSNGFLRLEILVDCSSASGEMTIGWTSEIPEIKSSNFRYFQITLVSGTLISSSKVVFHFTDEEIASAGLTEQFLTVYRYGGSQVGWEEIRFTLDTNANTITIPLDSFSYFAIAESRPWWADPMMLLIVGGIAVGIAIVVGIVIKRSRTRKVKII